MRLGKLMCGRYLSGPMAIGLLWTCVDLKVGLVKIGVEAHLDSAQPYPEVFGRNVENSGGCVNKSN